MSRLATSAISGKAAHGGGIRFYCLNGDCLRLTFAEHLADVAQLFGRRTARLHDLQHQLGLVLGGEAGARLATRIAVPTSPDTLLRLTTATASTGRVAAPRVLGVDDWAWRRGRHYGTVADSVDPDQPFRPIVITCHGDRNPAVHRARGCMVDGLVWRMTAITDS